MHDGRSSSPAANAAAISPLECPTTDEGLMPQVERSDTKAICNAVTAGWLILAVFMIDVSENLEISSVGQVQQCS
jgi:hypothetical protein